MAEWEMYEPCPDCGGTEFTQSVVQRETFDVSNGGPDEFAPVSGTHHVQAIWCRDCDMQVYNA